MNFNEFTIPSTPAPRKRRPAPRPAAVQATPAPAPVPERAIIQEPVPEPSQLKVEEAGTGMDIFRFGRNDFVRGIILSEILGKPRARRRFGR